MVGQLLRKAIGTQVEWIETTTGLRRVALVESVEPFEGGAMIRVLFTWMAMDCTDEWSRLRPDPLVIGPGDQVSMSQRPDGSTSLLFPFIGEEMILHLLNPKEILDPATIRPA